MQLPAELPLGLVFVTGLLDSLDAPETKGAPVEFVLGEAGHTLRCSLEDPSIQPSVLRRGMSLRAGGHLVFDAARADYYLIARDVEVVQEPDLPEEEEILTTLDGLEHTGDKPILTELERRASQNGLAPAEMPPWVETIAPAAVRAEMGVEASSAEIDALSPDDEPTLDEDLIAEISAALDGGGDIELTPEFLGKYVPAMDASELGRAAAPVAVPAENPSAGLANWIIGLLVVNLMLLTLILGAILYFLVI